MQAAKAPTRLTAAPVATTSYIIVKIVVANRGEIACRIIATLREMGITAVALYTEPDADAPHVWLADEAINLGAPTAYLDPQRVVAAARGCGAHAVHPGYGFLSESTRFAEACGDAGLVFVGPSAAAMRALGDKHAARQQAQSLGIAVVPGTLPLGNLATAGSEANRLGYPVLLKAAGGGGGKGMRRVNGPGEMREAFVAAEREAMNAFHDGRLLLEKYVVPARHIEVQVLVDGKRTVALGERECSLQRRYQKLVEEAPAATISTTTRQQIVEAAVRLTQAAGYAGAGTVEFLVGPDGQPWFLEVNTRLQVEHPVTEMLTGLDIVRAQIEIALGGSAPEPVAPRGHAIEVRLNAEDPYRDFVPQTGRVEMLAFPQLPGVRGDAGVDAGSVISPHYDALLAKIIAWGANREQARCRLVAALRATTLLGVVTNQSFLLQLLEADFFKRAETCTTSVAEHPLVAPAIPDYARAAAERAFATREAATPAAAGRDDVYSPWRALGTFREGL